MGFYYNRGLPQVGGFFFFSDTHKELKLRGEPKGNGKFAPPRAWFVGPSMAGAMLATQRDFREQKGQA